MRFYFEDGQERLDCRRKASEKYIEQAAIKLEKKGYQRPDPASIVAEARAETGSCTVEQISAMAKAGQKAEMAVMTRAEMCGRVMEVSS